MTKQIELAQRLLRIDPSCEVVHQALIRSYIEVGEPGAAQRQYKACKDVLKEELGIGPSPETDRALTSMRIREIKSNSDNNWDGKKEKPSLAVLPFANLADDPTLNYLALGLADDITTELTRFRELFVISRDSTIGVNLGTKDSPSLCRRLGVRHCLRGSLRATNRGLRINLHLVEGESGQNVWGERYDLSLEELPELSGDVLG